LVSCPQSTIKWKQSWKIIFLFLNNRYFHFLHISLHSDTEFSPSMNEFNRKLSIIDWWKKWKWNVFQWDIVDQTIYLLYTLSAPIYFSLSFFSTFYQCPCEGHWRIKYFVRFHRFFNELWWKNIYWQTYIFTIIKVKHKNNHGNRWSYIQYLKNKSDLKENYAQYKVAQILHNQNHKL
jgi:hypothetical protein